MGRDRDHQSHSDSVKVHEELLRKEGYRKSEARKVAEEAATILHSKLDKGENKT